MHTKLISPLGFEGNKIAGTDEFYAAISMENNAMGPQNGNTLASCTEGSSNKEICGHVPTAAMGMTRAAEDQGSNTVAGTDNMFTEKLFTGSLDLRNALQHGYTKAPGDHLQGSNVFLMTKPATINSNQKAERTQLGKRTGAHFERDRMQQKKPRHNTFKSRPPALKKLVSSPLQPKKESSERHGDGILAKQEKKPAAPSLFKAQPRLRFQDITKQEAALEYRQCVSLLRKYGVLHSREFYLSQKLPRCAPHPGSVGDKLQSKRCKICRAPEDTTSTIFCDGCQEAFHLDCCLPRLNLKHFDKEDDWYCGSCRKQKRRMGSRSFESGCLDRKLYSAELTYTSKVRLGSAHQAEVPIWTGKVDDSGTSGYFGMEETLSQDVKNEENAHTLKDCDHRVQASEGQVADTLSDGTSENWLKCNSVFVQPFTDKEGHEHSEIICGKWRRAPCNVKQSDRWECFCVIEWDPSHADCAVPQELPTEEVLQLIGMKSHLEQASEVHHSQVPKLDEAEGGMKSANE